MFGGGYLSCQESKSGNIKRLLLRFVVEKVNGKICVSCLLADTEKRSEVVWLVTITVTCRRGCPVGNEDIH